MLILDESTSALDVSTRDRLFAECAAPVRRGHRRRLHLAPHGRAAGDRRPQHRAAQRRGGRRRSTGPRPPPRGCCSSCRRARRSRPASGAPAPPRTASCCGSTASCCAAPATPSRSTCTPARSSASRGWRATGRSASCARSAASTRPSAARCCASATAGRRRSARSVRPPARHRLRAARPQDRGHLRAALHPRQLLAAHDRPRRTAGFISERHRRAALPPVRRPAQDPLRLGRQPHHDALRRQPAEGRHRPLARRRSRTSWC